MEATTQERQRKSRLVQSQTKTKVKTDSQESEGFGPNTLINAAEFLIIIGAAITVDVIDVLDLTGVGAIIVRIIDVPILGALWLWRILKHQSGPKKDPTFLLLSAFLVELSPVGMIPTWTIFVAYIYFQDTKIGKTATRRTRKIPKTKKKK